MARYVTTIRTARSVDEVFAAVSDMRRFAEWDPGTKRVVQIDGDQPGLDARYDVVAAGPGRDITLHYRVVEWDPPRGFVARAESGMLVSLDRITVRSDGGATLLTYDADLRLKGLLRVADLGLRLVFGRIGDKAAAGLATFVDGTIVSG